MINNSKNNKNVFFGYELVRLEDIIEKLEKKNKCQRNEFQLFSFIPKINRMDLNWHLLMAFVDLD